MKSLVNLGVWANNASSLTADVGLHVKENLKKEVNLLHQGQTSVPVAVAVHYWLHSWHSGCVMCLCE